MPAMSLIIHRSTTAAEMWYLARHAVRSKCSPGHVIGGRGKQRFHQGLGTWSPPACASRWFPRCAPPVLPVLGFPPRWTVPGQIRRGELLAHFPSEVGRHNPQPRLRSTPF